MPFKIHAIHQIIVHRNLVRKHRKSSGEVRRAWASHVCILGQAARSNSKALQDICHARADVRVKDIFVYVSN